MKKLVIVNGGLGDPSTTGQIASRIAEAAVRQVTSAGEGLDVVTVDLRSLATDLATYMTTHIAPTALDEARRTVTGADALIAATPVFQGSYAGLFKLFFDTLDMHALNGIPVTLVATAGTARHSMVLDYALRPLLSFLHAVVLPTGVFAATEEFGTDSGLDGRIDRAAGELAGQLTAVGGVAGFTQHDGRTDASGQSQDKTDADFRVPTGGFAALLSGHTGQ